METILNFFFYINKLELYLRIGFYSMLEDLQEPVGFLESLWLVSMTFPETSEIHGPWGIPLSITVSSWTHIYSSNSYQGLNCKEQFMDVHPWPWPSENISWNSARWHRAVFQDLILNRLYVDFSITSLHWGTLPETLLRNSLCFLWERCLSLSTVLPSVLSIRTYVTIFFSGYSTRNSWAMANT